jgi:hypothetical protein
VATLAEALACFFRTRVDLLVLVNWMVWQPERTGQTT